MAAPAKRIAVKPCEHHYCQVFMRCGTDWSTAHVVRWTCCLCQHVVDVRDWHAARPGECPDEKGPKAP